LCVVARFGGEILLGDSLLFASRIRFAVGTAGV
jgi:hypothetical protein